jgi:hypothetical protein
MQKESLLWTLLHSQHHCVYPPSPSPPPPAPRNSIKWNQVEEVLMPSCNVLISPLLNHMNVWFKYKWLLYIIKCTVSGEGVKVHGWRWKPTFRLLLIHIGGFCNGCISERIYTVRKMDLILCSIEWMLQTQLSMARRFKLQVLRRYNVKFSKMRNFTLDTLRLDKLKSTGGRRTNNPWIYKYLLRQRQMLKINLHWLERAMPSYAGTPKHKMVPSYLTKGKIRQFSLQHQFVEWFLKTKNEIGTGIKLIAGLDVRTLLV